MLGVDVIDGVILGVDVIDGVIDGVILGVILGVGDGDGSGTLTAINVKSQSGSVIFTLIKA